MMKREGNIISSLFGCFILYLAAKYFWRIYPLDSESEHLCETVGDVYIIYLVIAIAFFFCFYMVMIFGEFTNIHKKIDEIGKKLESIEAALPKEPEKTVDETSKEEASQKETKKNEGQI